MSRLSLFSASVALGLLWPVPAMAMNWEGHDDWMLNFAPAFMLEQFAPEARPLPRRDCPVRPEDSVKNPYEQIPLPRHNCQANSKEAAPQR